MPYVAKGKCVYKRDTGKKVGCTKGSVKKYLAALHANVSDASESVSEAFDTVMSPPLKISGLINQLNELKRKHGDVTVNLVNGESGRYEAVNGLYPTYPEGAGGIWDRTKPVNGIVVTTQMHQRKGEDKTAFLNEIESTNVDVQIDNDSVHISRVVGGIPSKTTVHLGRRATPEEAEEIKNDVLEADKHIAQAFRRRFGLEEDIYSSRATEEYYNILKNYGVALKSGNSSAIRLAEKELSDSGIKLGFTHSRIERDKRLIAASAKQPISHAKKLREIIKNTVVEVLKENGLSK